MSDNGVRCTVIGMCSGIEMYCTLLIERQMLEQGKLCNLTYVFLYTALRVCSCGAGSGITIWTLLVILPCILYHPPSSYAIQSLI